MLASQKTMAGFGRMASPMNNVNVGFLTQDYLEITAQ